GLFIGGLVFDIVDQMKPNARKSGAVCGCRPFRLRLPGRTSSTQNTIGLNFEFSRSTPPPPRGVIRHPARRSWASPRWTWGASLEPSSNIPPPLVGGGKGEGCCARQRARESLPTDRRAIRACRRETPPPAPAHNGRGNAAEAGEAPSVATPSS